MSLEEIKQARLKKLHKIENGAAGAFPISAPRDFSLLEAVNDFVKLSRRRKSLRLAGRVMGVRTHGGVIFCDFKDGSFDRKEQKTVLFQAYLKKDILGEEKFSEFEEQVDIGDFLEFEGTLFKTQKGEKSIKVTSWRLAAKSLSPLPEKWHGLLDIEERYRKRYLDLLMNNKVRFVFEIRSAIIGEIRSFLSHHNFVEVETPMLQSLAGGALAEPFKTRHNALGMDLFLRIAPELSLKKLLIGGFEKVYELGRNFRNEGIDATHNPEFTMLEFYQAYQDAAFMRTFVEDLVRTVVKKVFGRLEIKCEDNDINFSKEFSVVSFNDVLKRHALINDPEKSGIDDFKLKAQQFGIETADSDTKEKIADNIFKKICRPKIIQPTFVIDHPIGLSPLAKRKEDNPELADRFQLVAGGLELANGFSELNDPLDQQKRFEVQREMRKSGDQEALEFDKDYLEAMEYGMPPAAGVGIGIDRLVMLLLDIHNIKDVLLFPTMRPKD